MNWQNRHVVLIGFKHVGKSVIGRFLAPRLQRNYIDLDREIERLYALQSDASLSCREIVQTEGEVFFRNLEHQALAQAIATPLSVISLGGGTPMLADNQTLLRGQCIIYITAPPIQVFQRIMRKGRPAFFPEHEDPWVTFNRLWLEREIIYKSLATVSVRNHRSIDLTIAQLIKHFQ